MLFIASFFKETTILYAFSWILSSIINAKMFVVRRKNRLLFHDIGYFGVNYICYIKKINERSPGGGKAKIK